nr:H-NS histone family protein [Methylomarinum sp. Ch1-1]MDP4523295.1 H-NS histone family protein [Methylomarinum sp. Ch1-1]
MADAAGVHVEITEKGKRSHLKGKKVPVKYQNPENTSEKWSGRGLYPKWLQKLLDSGRSLEEFKVE